MMQAQEATRAALESKHVDPCIATRTFLRPDFLAGASAPKCKPFTSISFFPML